jgi:hypothetical protein
MDSARRQIDSFKGFVIVSGTLSANPIPDPQPWYALKLPLAVGYYREACRFSVRGDP